MPGTVRGERMLTVANELITNSKRSRMAVLDVLNEVEDALELERKRASFLTYYGRYLNMLDNKCWFDLPDNRSTDKFNSPQQAIDAAMALINWM
jgi:hypothetical protein